jgi:hypothetical protein
MKKIILILMLVLVSGIAYAEDFWVSPWISRGPILEYPQTIIIEPVPRLILPGPGYYEQGLMRIGKFPIGQSRVIIVPIYPNSAYPGYHIFVPYPGW